MTLDVDANPCTASAYRVQRIPTWLVFKNSKSVGAKVSDAAIATLTPDETARVHLAGVLGQVDACS
jgi:thioredoxin-like negative regulator of GroEL